MYKRFKNKLTSGECMSPKFHNNHTRLLRGHHNTHNEQHERSRVDPGVHIRVDPAVHIIVDPAVLIIRSVRET
jgi:hypothetical protein